MLLPKSLEEKMDIKLRNMTSVYFVRDEELLCLYRIGSRVANQRYVGAAGGHFEPEELNDPRRCVLREMQEELGLTEGDTENLTLRYITYRLVEGELRQNYYFFGSLKTDLELTSNEGTLRWVPFSEVKDLHMPVSAKPMLMHFVQEGRFTDHLYAGVTEETGTRFVPMVEFEG